MKNCFKVSYELYESTVTGDFADPVECEVDGYEDVETLKSETKEVIEKITRFRTEFWYPKCKLRKTVNTSIATLLN